VQHASQMRKAPAWSGGATSSWPFTLIRASLMSDESAGARPAEPGAGYINDFISELPVRATVEEVEAVQVFSRRLVEDFGYPKEVITTRPQFRVRRRPSEVGGKGYPIDIAVFTKPAKSEDDLLIVIECKRPTVQEGERQLKTYLSLSSATIGVWFNGNDHLYLHKGYLPDGTISWTLLPTIPKWGQSVSDIGLLKRRDLKTPRNLKAVFRDLRNHLAGNTTGITRDQALAEEIMSILFCKIYDELDTGPDDLPRFRTSPGEDSSRVIDRINGIFADVVRQYADVFSQTETITLDPNSLTYVVGELQNYEVTSATRDAVGEAFEVFIGPAVRGEEGQFFTPRNVVQLMVELIDPKPGERIIDPACGSGGFLVVALEHMWKKIEEEAASKGWSDTVLERRRREAATQAIRGIDKDSFLVKVAKAYMAIIGDGRVGIFCQDSLADSNQWDGQARAEIRLGSFDVAITNPPFGSKIKVTGSQKLGQFKLARAWKQPKSVGGDWELTQVVRKEQAPQILFIERCIQLLKPGGRLAIILPESLFGVTAYGWVVQYLFENFAIRAFISLPEEVFQPYTHAKTCVVVLENAEPSADDEIAMAIADWCGHDSRGKPTLRMTSDGQLVELDDLPRITETLKPLIPWSG
jgi:type I restriction enzyme M protein